jgi:hypothetical protein
MSAGLPNVNQLVTQIQAKVAEHDAKLEKQSAAPEPSFNTVVATNLYKLAQNLRSTATQPLTYADVRRFVAKVGG